MQIFTEARCAYDSGSMYGCQPACSRPALLIVTHFPGGGYGPFTSPVCAAHKSPTLGRIFPDRYTLSPIGA